MNTQQQNISDNNFEQCIKCTICTIYCPVVPVNPRFPGPKQAGPDGERLRLRSEDYFDEALKYCMNCKRCEVACPSDVKIGDIIQSARMKHHKARPILRDIMLANTDFMGTFATKLAPLANFTLGLKPMKMLMDSMMKIDSRRTFPTYAFNTFESWYKKHAAAKQQAFKQRVSYFHGCYVNYNFPRLGKDLVHVMNAIGYGVDLLEKENCCGVALMSNGLIKQAKRKAEKNVQTITKAVQERGQTIVGTSSTCIFTLRDEYPHLLHIDNSRIRNSVELGTRFIYRLVSEGKVKLAFKKDYKARVAYHTPCHMEKLGWAIYSTALMKMIPGLELLQVDSHCCGIAGTYGFKKENYESSQQIGSHIFKQIEDFNVDFVASDCETCKWQIEMSTTRKVKNPITILAEAIDVEETARINGFKR